MKSNPIVHACFSTFLLLSLSLSGACSSSSTDNAGANDGGGGGGTGDGASGGEGGGKGGGEGGPNALCGNGNVDPGENCDGSNLNSSSCTSLGFESGTLKCAASCQFDTSGCANAFTPTVVPSRTTCSAPCSVFFDATTTTGLTNNDYVAANFNWDFDSTEVNPVGVHQHTIGFNVAHVYDVPGTYQVSLRVRDLAGKAGAITVPITVTAMTGPTIYVAATGGSDSNDGKTMGAAMATLTGALAKYSAAQTSILLRRGDTFNIAKATIPIHNITGPFLIGAYQDPAVSSTNAPILNSTITFPPANYQTIIEIQNSSDLRLTDLHIKSTQAAYAIQTTTSTHTLVERVEIEGIGYETEGLQNFSLDGASSNSFYVDCNLHDFVGYGLYGDSVNQLAVIGTTMANFSGGDHGVRVAGGTTEYVAENTVNAATGDDSTSAFSALTFRGDADKHPISYNKNIVCVDNRVNRILEFTPENTSSEEYVSDGLLEGNIRVDERAADFSGYSIDIAAKHIVVRNNVFVNAPLAVKVVNQPQLTTTPGFISEIAIYNNTYYFFPGPGDYNSEYPANFIENDTTGSVTAQNNIFAIGISAGGSNFVVGGTVTEDHNLSYGPNFGGGWNPASGVGDIVGNPKFVSTDPTNASAFQLSTGSAAIDVGAMTPAYQDLAGATRPVGAGWDIGAYEFR